MEALLPILLVALTSGLPAHPPPPKTCTLLFHGLGNHTSIPIPGDVEGDPAMPGFPGPISSLIRQRSRIADRFVGMPSRFRSSPLANALTRLTLTFASGMSLLLIESLQGNSVAFAC